MVGLARARERESERERENRLRTLGAVPWEGWWALRERESESEKTGHEPFERYRVLTRTLPASQYPRLLFCVQGLGVGGWRLEVGGWG